MNHKITLFASSSVALNLVSYLFSKELLACVVVTSRLDADSQMLLQTLSQHNIPHFVFNENDDRQNLDILNQVKSDLALVFGFSHKLSSLILKHFNNDIFNIHASLLPKYRGSQPLFWQLKNGEASSALSLCRISENFDDGEIVIQKKFDIDSKDTFGILVGTVSKIVINIVDEFLSVLNKEEKILSASAQIGKATSAPKVEAKDIIIEWEKMNSMDIVNLARACNPIFGGAQTVLKSFYLNILEATIVDMPNLGLKAGTIIHIGAPEGLIVSTIDSAVRVDIISVPDGVFSGLRFAKRFNIDAGDRFLSTV
ncbi:MAG: formyltransferase family protein [Sphaerochaetaceae bacterium]|nr:formyltransferase family protein [Sphaerochaetaceae bacterium]